MKWDASTDRLLLLAILESHNITVNYEAVARNIGNGCSASAVYQQLHKIRKRVTENRSDMAKKTSKKGGKKGKMSFGDDEEEDIKNFKPRPFLRRKVKTEQGEREIKHEEKEMVIKREKGSPAGTEKGQPETRKGVQFSDVIIIDDGDDDGDDDE